MEPDCLRRFAAMVSEERHPGDVNRDELIVTAREVLTYARAATYHVQRLIRLVDRNSTVQDAIEILSAVLVQDAVTGGAANCAEWRGAYGDREFSISVQWSDGKSPHALIDEARRERDEARAALEGSAVAPTVEEIDTLEASGGHWLVMLDWSDGGALVPDLYDAERAREKVRGSLDAVPRVVAWRAIDRDGRLLPRPQVAR